MSIINKALSKDSYKRRPEEAQLCWKPLDKIHRFKKMNGKMVALMQSKCLSYVDCENIIIDNRHIHCYMDGPLI